MWVLFVIRWGCWVLQTENIFSFFGACGVFCIASHVLPFLSELNRGVCKYEIDISLLANKYWTPPGCLVAQNIKSAKILHTWNIGSSSSVHNCLSIVIVVERQGTLLLEIGYEQTCTKKDIQVKLFLLGWIYKEYIQRIKVAFQRGVAQLGSIFLVSQSVSQSFWHCQNVLIVTVS